jgi:hypothetical protein
MGVGSVLVFQIGPARETCFWFFNAACRAITDRVASTAHQFTWHKADMMTALSDVCFRGKADIGRTVLNVRF